MLEDRVAVDKKDLQSNVCTPMPHLNLNPNLTLKRDIARVSIHHRAGLPAMASARSGCCALYNIHKKNFKM